MAKTKQRIKEWYDRYNGQVYVSFSGGKDSTVLLEIANQMFDEGLIPEKIPAVYIDTGLEYPEVKQFVHSKDASQITIVRPKMGFREVLEHYGYPAISKEQAQYIYQYKTAKSQKTKDTRMNGNKWGLGKISEKWKYLVDAPFKISDQCCNVMKKKPAHDYEKTTGRHPIIAIMACESIKRSQDYLRTGCNAFDAKRPTSKPMGFWTEQDVLLYLKMNNLAIASVYGDIIEDTNGSLRLTGVTRTGCMFCMFGVHLEKAPNRFQRMKETHPRIYEYCMSQLGIGKVLDYIKVPYK